jgi:trigger factor
VLRRQRTTYASVERAAQAGDRVYVDFTGTIDGVEFAGGQARDFPIVLGEGRMLPEFEKAVTGARAGETREFPLTFPADYHGREVAGKEAAFALTVHRVEAPDVPALDADFAKAFGIASGSIDDLRKEVEANLHLELKRKVESTVKAQALSGLRQRATFDVPKALVESEAQSLRQRAIANMREQQNAKPEDLEQLSVDVFRPQAEERVALGLIIAELVRAEQLHAKPEQVKALVAETAQTYEQPDAVVRWHYEKPERLRDFEAMVLEQNVVDWMLARAKVTDEPVTFESIMGQRTSG